jgi:hypothetical protein
MPMRSRTHRVRTHLLLIVAVLTLAMISACTQPPTPVEPTTDPTATPLFATDDEALAAATEAYAKYQKVSDEILIDGGAHPERLLDVATQDFLDVQIIGYQQAEANGLRSTGGSMVDSTSLQFYDPNSVSGEAVVGIYGCADVSRVDVVDASGASVVSPGRPDRSPFEAVFDSSSEGLKLAKEDPWSGSNFCE